MYKAGGMPPLPASRFRYTPAIPQAGWKCQEDLKDLTEGVVRNAAWFHLASPHCCPSPASPAALSKAFQTQCFHSWRRLNSQSTSAFCSQPFTVFPFSLSLADCGLFITSQLFLNLKQTENWCVTARICLWNGWVGEEENTEKWQKTKTTLSMQQY